MSSVTIGLEVLAVIVILVVLAVGCCCIAFCVFQIMEQEFQRTERMIWANAHMQPRDVGAPEAGTTSIEINYHPEDYDNDNVTSGYHSLNYPSNDSQPGTTTAETTTTTITTTITSPPATESTVPTASTAATHVYTGTETQRHAGAQRLVMTADENDGTSTNPRPETPTRNNSNDQNNVHVVNPLDEPNHDLNNEKLVENTERKEKSQEKMKITFKDLLEMAKQELSKEESHEESQVSKKSQDPQEQFKSFLMYPEPKQYPYVGNRPLAGGDEKVDFDKFLKISNDGGGLDTQRIHQIQKESRSRSLHRNVNSEQDIAWRFMARKQMACINAEPNGWHGWTEMTEYNHQNEKSSIAKKID